MRSTKAIRAAKIGSILLSALIGALGLLLALRPGLSLFLIGRVVGATMVVFGIVKLVGYFAKDLYRLAFQFDLAFGILLIIVAVLIALAASGVCALTSSFVDYANGKPGNAIAQMDEADRKQIDDALAQLRADRPAD